MNMPLEGGSPSPNLMEVKGSEAQGRHREVTVHLMKTGIMPQLVIASHRQEGETGPLRHAGRLHVRR
jgi:hypothetical protein